HDGPFYNNAFLDLVVDNLGLTMIRNNFYPDFEPQNENGDPHSLDMQAFNYSGKFMTRQRDWLIALKNKAAASGEPMRFTAAYWTPPAWMKTNGDEIGGSLREDMYDKFAEYAVATVRAYKQQCDIDLYALSLENEPRTVHPWESCVYTATEYRDLVALAGPRLHAESADLKLFGAEDGLRFFGTFEGALMADTLTRRQMHALAVHDYYGGDHPTPTAEAKSMYRRAAGLCAGVGKPLWMTETSGYDDSWDDCMLLAENMLVGLKYGKLSAWMWWQLGNEGPASVYELTNRGVPTRRLYIVKHFSRYIRPGAVGIDCESSDTLVAAVAFHHPDRHTLTVVLVNTAGSAITVDVSAQGLTEVTAYRSTADRDCADIGTVQAASVRLPARSVTTLVAADWTPSTATLPMIGAAPRPALSSASTRAYDLRGRHASRNGHGAHPAAGLTVIAGPRGVRPRLLLR
ncbi:MAG: hypothetical protein GF331_15620, partial [Chitinivibrionales bacterium]|nr:hypothetical protein [Chitinivibrionales bacterium]